MVNIQAGNSRVAFTLEDATATGGLTASATTVANSGTVALSFTGAPSQTVAWSIVSGPGALSGQQTTTNASGIATATLTADPSGSGDILVRATVDGKDYDVMVTIGVAYSLVAQTPTSGAAFVSSAKTTAIAKMQLQQNGVAYTGPSLTINWTVLSADNSANLAVTSTNRNLATGLDWGDNATTSPGTALSTPTTSYTDGSGNASMNLTDIMGQRKVTVQASVTAPDGQTYTQTQELDFGAGPLSKFDLTQTSGAVGSGNWDAAYLACNGTTYTGDHSTGWTLNAYVGGPGGKGTDSATGKMPIRDELVAVSGGGSRPEAYLAAGWPGNFYWTGDANHAHNAFILNVSVGHADYRDPVAYVIQFVCRR